MSERTTRQNQTRNLLLSLRKLTDDNIKHINWWLDGKPDGPVTRPWGRVAFFNRNTVRDAARKYFYRYRFSKSETMVTAEKLFGGKP
jgi:hypothetical protein